ncbi:hypothetical protein X744_20980 [Mesorhizobium sp. LNJC372A00]|nr:hypothetical protein X753_00245 [Mesorhizobium sp. LNJC399B00]ESY24315.1 hypothetical protein X750_09430 [Mesorhizobium sp. LNJC394B00]ESY51410.1 hypothetical protein X745_24000 [Mesorhizobium sp. LNJC374B00]ESY56835.1 hypothetical protein X744_20980 [Mesorhizobium sp. LNJC372A00]ESZ43644.1 hypothetical protein X730_27655 [Mesorhizobium sp. L103C565B0]
MKQSLKPNNRLANQIVGKVAFAKTHSRLAFIEHGDSFLNFDL